MRSHYAMPSRFTLFVLTILFCSCATESITTTQFPNKQQEDLDGSTLSLSDRLSGGFKQETDEQGNVRMVSDRRSSFDGMRYEGNLTPLEKKTVQFHSVEKKDAQTRKSFQLATREWRGTKEFTQSSLSTPEFITRAQGLKTSDWKDRNKQFATTQSAVNGQTWHEGVKRFDSYDNTDIIRKRQNFGQPTIMTPHQAGAKTIEETRAMMGRAD